MEIEENSSQASHSMYFSTKDKTEKERTSESRSSENLASNWCSFSKPEENYSSFQHSSNRCPFFKPEENYSSSPHSLANNFSKMTMEIEEEIYQHDSFREPFNSYPSKPEETGYQRGRSRETSGNQERGRSRSRTRTPFVAQKRAPSPPPTFSMKRTMAWWISQLTPRTSRRNGQKIFSWKFCCRGRCTFNKGPFNNSAVTNWRKFGNQKILKPSFPFSKHQRRGKICGNSPITTWINGGERTANTAVKWYRKTRSRSTFKGLCKTY